MVSGTHSIYTHFPKDRNCEVCLRIIKTRAPCRRRTGAAILRAENFGDLITADHKVLSEGCESRNNHRHAVACKTKNFSGNREELTKVLGTDEETKSHLHWQFPRIWQSLWRLSTNGIAERAVRRIKEGTSAVLLQSGLEDKWWMECCCYQRNIQDPLSDGKTLYERRFGEPFKGPIISFDSMVEYHPVSAKDLSRLHQFGKKVIPIIFLGYV